MAEKSDAKGHPNSLWAILGTLLVGWFAIRNGPGTSSDAKKPAPAGASTVAASASHSPASSTLLPLEQALLGQPLSTPEKTAEAIAEQWEQKYGKDRDQVRVNCLIALVPDPMGASISFRFDETMDSIERAAAVHQFVLERWRFPWEEKAEEAQQRALALGFFSGVIPGKPAAPSGATSEHAPPHDPGVLVFRKVRSSNESKAGKTKVEDLLAVFLVPETPTYGADRRALATSLRLTNDIERAFPGLKGYARRTIRIVGPSFSGSRPSLRDGLVEWLRGINGGSRTGFAVKVISGGAMAFDSKEFVHSVEPLTSSCEFWATIHRSKTVREAVLRYLLGNGLATGGGARENENEAGPVGYGKGVAILSELNTGAGAGAISGSELEVRLNRTSLRYPLHIAEIRKAYETQGILRDGASDTIRSPLEIRQLAQESSKARDVLPDQTPALTAMNENRVLTQALKYLEDGGFHTIGIVASDPHDAAFLARLISRYCPDARVFIVGADLMLLDPESIADLRGVLVGSTYPLHPLNHEWTGSDESSRGEVFPSQHAQGTYNAATILVNEAITPWDPGRGLLEYGTPKALNEADEKRATRPPIWISKVGERAIYPVDCVSQFPGRDADSPDDDYMYGVVGMPRGASRLIIERVAGWLAYLGGLLAVTGGFWIYRLSAIEAAATDGGVPGYLRGNWHLAVVDVSLVALLAFAAQPLFSVELAGHRRIQYLFGGLVVAGLASALAGVVWIFHRVARELSGEPRPTWPLIAIGAEATAVAGVVAALLVACSRGDAWSRLQALRLAAMTSGLSPLIPLTFLAAAVGAVAWASHRLSKIRRVLGCRTPWAEEPADAERADLDVIASIEGHRARFDGLFEELRRDEASAPRETWPATVLRLLKSIFKDYKSHFVIWALMAGIAFDAIVLRPIRPTDEGRAFDALARSTVAGLLLWIGLQGVRLTRAWKELKKVLSGYAKILDDGFRRIPNRASSWYLNEDVAMRDYAVFVPRQIGHVRSLLEDKKVANRPSTLVTRVSRCELRRDLDLLEAWNRSSASDRPEDKVLEQAQQICDPKPRLPKEDCEESATIRRIIAILKPVWDARSVSPKAATDDKKKGSPGEYDIVLAMEDLLALLASRWIGGALARIWTLVGALVVASLAMLFAITSYPFPAQPRAMALLGVVTAAIVILVLKVTLEVNRDEVLSLQADSAPGKLTWDATLFGNLVAYVVPLVGVLAALSMDATDLFRSVLGPILRFFP